MLEHGRYPKLREFLADGESDVGPGRAGGLKADDDSLRLQEPPR